MNETEQEREMAARIYDAIQRYSGYDARSQQSREYRVGVSDLGYCSERTRRMLNRETPQDTDLLAAFLGTAIGKDVELAVKAYAMPHALLQESVTLVLEGGSRTYEINGHPDIIDPGGTLLDVKTSFGLALPARSGAEDRQKKFQRHGYAKAADQKGLFNVPLSEVMVGNVWIDRSGQDKYALVNLEPYDPLVIDDMTEWLEEVIYDFVNEQPAPKEPPREVCRVTCGFFGPCRGYDTDVAGLLTDKTVLSAIAMYEEGKELAGIGRRLQEQAKPALAGVDGFAEVEGERFSLRWTHVNETLVPETKRRAHDKIELRKVT